MESQESIKSELKEGEEFDYNGEIGSINATPTSETSVKVGHFVIKKDERRKGYGSHIFEALLSVLRENGYMNVTVEIQAVEDGSQDDPVMDFLRNYNFRYLEDFEHYNWGTCVRATGNI